jgi:hypothetical protein
MKEWQTGKIMYMHDRPGQTDDGQTGPILPLLAAELHPSLCLLCVQMLK